MVSLNYKSIITIFTISICLNLIAQKTKKHKVYFEVDSHQLTDNEKSNLISFIEEYKSKIKHNRRVEITCIISGHIKPKSETHGSVTKKSTDKPKVKGMNYYDFLNHVVDS